MSEWSAVQKPMLQYADDIGWKPVRRDDALRLRGDDTGLYFIDTLRAQLVALNPGVVMQLRPTTSSASCASCLLLSRATTMRSNGCAASGRST